MEEDQSDQKTIADHLTINELNLESEMATCAGFFFTYSCLAIDAEEIANNATIALESYEADLAEQFKLNFTPTKKNDEPTQTEIKRRYRADDKWNLLKKEQLKCERNQKVLEKGAKAFEIKSNMLMSMNKRDVQYMNKGMKN